MSMHPIVASQIADWYAHLAVPIRGADRCIADSKLADAMEDVGMDPRLIDLVRRRQLTYSRCRVVPKMFENVFRGTNGVMFPTSPHIEHWRRLPGFPKEESGFGPLMLACDTLQAVPRGPALLFSQLARLSALVKKLQWIDRLEICISEPEPRWDRFGKQLQELPFEAFGVTFNELDTFPSELAELLQTKPLKGLSVGSGLVATRTLLAEALSSIELRPGLRSLGLDLGASAAAAVLRNPSFAGIDSLTLRGLRNAAAALSGFVLPRVRDVTLDFDTRNGWAEPRPRFRYDARWLARLFPEVECLRIAFYDDAVGELPLPLRYIIRQLTERERPLAAIELYEYKDHHFPGSGRLHRAVETLVEARVMPPAAVIHGESWQQLSTLLTLLCSKECKTDELHFVLKGEHEELPAKGDFSATWITTHRGERTAVRVWSRDLQDLLYSSESGE